MPVPGRHIAITAKVRAMYGKRLRESDFARLSACKNLGELLNHLKASPAWAPALLHMSPKDVSRASLEEALHTHVMEETARLYRFMASTGKGTLLFPLYRFELTCILQRFQKLQMSIPDFFKTASKLDFNLLSHALTWRDIVRAGERTIYKQALAEIPLSPESGKPDILALELALWGAYYKKLFHHSFGAEADLKNITHILRLKQSFPHMLNSAEALLIPVFYKLKPAFFQRLIEAKDQRQAMLLLDETIYGPLFRKFQFSRIEQYAACYLEDLNRKELLKAVPSPYIPAAYLHLKGQELSRLIQTIEEVYYKRQEAPWQ